VRKNPAYAMNDDDLKRLIRDNPWATLVCQTSAGLMASHYPVLVDESHAELSLLTHLGRPDDVVMEIGQRELLVIVQGPHGYISPSWYDANPAVPTWNFTVAHLSGIPELLAAEENYQVLGQLVDFFEGQLPQPRQMRGSRVDAEYSRRISAGTLGLRLTPTRITTKAKLSQDKSRAVVDSVIRSLEGDGPYAQPVLAAEMRRAHQRG